MTETRYLHEVRIVTNGLRIDHLQRIREEHYETRRLMAASAFVWLPDTPLDTAPAPLPSIQTLIAGEPTGDPVMLREAGYLNQLQDSGMRTVVDAIADLAPQGFVADIYAFRRSDRLSIGERAAMNDLGDLLALEFGDDDEKLFDLLTKQWR